MAALGAHPMATWHLQFVPREGLGELASAVDNVFDRHFVFAPPKPFRDLTPDEKKEWKREQKKAWEHLPQAQKDEILERERAARKRRRERKEAAKGKT